MKGCRMKVMERCVKVMVGWCELCVRWGKGVKVCEMMARCVGVKSDDV